jgi:beta-mannosidase
MRTIEMFTGPDERRLDSAAMLSHQKHPRGYDLIREYMERWYRVQETFEDYVYVSQLLQAEGMRIGVAAQRRAMPYCMGTLYWQLNDCWPAVSWSSIDYSGEWKALHYAAKRAFEPLIVSTVEKEGSLHVYIVSDRLEELGGWISMKLAGFDGTVLWERVLTVKAPSNGSLDIFSIPLDELLSGADRSSVVFSAVFDCPGEKPSRAIRYFAHPKDLKLPAAEIEFVFVDGSRGMTLELTSGVLAKNVFLQLDGNGHSSGSIHFPDNFFDMLPGETIAVIIDTDLPAEEIRNRITIKTLRDTY